MRDFLRSLPVFADGVPDFDPHSAPSQPADLFTEWLHAAVADGVPEPHALTLSTCDADGLPDARVLILKDLDEQGWWFATSTDTVKAQQLQTCPAAALTFHWPQVGRQIRVRGPVVVGSTERSAADFAARGAAARSLVAPEDWQVYAVAAEAVEFWQAAADRRHLRLQYRRHASGWTRDIVWHP